MDWYWWLVILLGCIIVLWALIKIGLFRLIGEILEVTFDIFS